MYLTALHVVRAADGAEGINSFYYAHPGTNWLVPPANVPDGEPGVLVSSQIELPPGGNRVRSYLDIVTHEGASWSELRRSFLVFVLDSEGGEFPWVRLVGRTRFRAGMELALAPEWRAELSALFAAAREAKP